MNTPVPLNERRRKRSGQRRSGEVRRLRRVAVQIPADNSLNRAKIRGILEYLQKSRQWEIPLTAQFPSLSDEELRHWDGDGVIGNMLPMLPLALSLRDSGVTVVNTAAGMDKTLPLPTVSVDSPGIARLAAEHLLARKFRHFAFAGFGSAGEEPELHFRRREKTFRDCIRARGFPCESYWVAYRRHSDVMSERPWLRFVNRWARPVAVFACSDQAGFGIIRACRALGVQVPDEVAVIGVDDDEVFCHLAIPRMTSIDPRGEVVGYRAAALLDRLLDGNKVDPLFQVIAPGEVRLRESTDVLATSNMDVAEVLRFIHSHVRDPITVQDILRVVPVSRRTLERHFRDVTGTGIHEYIRRAHVDLARESLAGTDVPLEEVARRSGFRNAHRMKEAFEAVWNQPVSAFRRASPGTGVT